MTRFSAAAFAAILLAAAPAAIPANAHVIAGNRVFPVTLTIDDPGTADEVSLPSFQYQRVGSNGGTGPTHDYAYGFEWDKLITSNTALIFNDGYNVQQMNGSKTQAGWQNLFITGKWEFYLNPEHEFVSSFGVIREIGGTSTLHAGGDKYGSTTPTLYFGKGLGDLNTGFFRPFAVTGELSYLFADTKLKQFTAAPQPMGANLTTPIASSVSPQFNSGTSNGWSGGLSLQYSLPYLQSQVKDVGLTGFLADLVPLVEVRWTSPASKPSNRGVTWTVAPGVVYLTGWGEIGLEAVIPANRTTGTTLGAVALVHFFLDDLMPNTLGKPIFE